MEKITCPIDAKFCSQISALLNPPDQHEVQKYFEELIKAREYHGLKVKQSGEYGKGVCAETDFEEGELVLKDQMLFGIQHSSNKMECLVCSFCFRFIGSIELQIGRKIYLQELGISTNNVCDSSDGEAEDYVNGDRDFGECSSSSAQSKPTLPKKVVESLMNEDVQLPYSREFLLPSVIPCPSGCKEEFYCSKICAEADWESFHSLLCTGDGSNSLNREALLKFIEHANETNDIFLLAAKAIAFTISRYRKLKANRVNELQNHFSLDHSAIGDPSLLLEAWKPVAMGYKRRWWDCIALPDDVNSCDEEDFRVQIRELAMNSLQLLKEAIFDKELEPLFSLEIYGHIIGMFELNNLDLVVASPVEDYFLYIDDLPDSDKKKAEEVTQPFLDALGDGYSICCQGTAFFPLQSCMNHSCSPNAKAFKREEDRDGQATIIALRPIHRGEEITISYIDEDLPVDERQRSLADYGFRCRCPKCLEEESPQ